MLPHLHKKQGEKLQVAACIRAPVVLRSEADTFDHEMLAYMAAAGCVQHESHDASACRFNNTVQLKAWRVMQQSNRLT